VEPVYPPAAARRGEEGTVALLVHVAPTGVPRSVEVIQSSGFKALDESARNAVLTWHFHPGIREGTPVDSDFTLQVRFRVDR
jgi:protein TonB